MHDYVSLAGEAGVAGKSDRSRRLRIAWAALTIKEWTTQSECGLSYEIYKKSMSPMSAVLSQFSYL
jgi:hypothetical protein